MKNRGNTPKTDKTVKEVIKMFSVDASSGRVYMDISRLLTELDDGADWSQFVVGNPRIDVTEKNGVKKAILHCKQGFYQAIIDGQKDSGHIACLLTSRFREPAMLILFKDLYKNWLRYLQKKEARAAEQREKEQQKINNVGQTDHQIHNEVSRLINSRSSLRSWAKEERGNRSNAS